MKLDPSVEQYRFKTGPYASPPNHTCGAFMIPYKTSKLYMIVSNGSEDGWEHVSVSLKNRCPNWLEMCFIKDKFWDEEECVMQVHPPKSEWINNHPFCLHMWRPLKGSIPKPPSIAVGVKE